MSYIKNRIEKNRAEDPVYRAAYDEEVDVIARETLRRQEVMQRVTTLRKAKHVSQQAVADAMQISQARVSQMERGTETLSLDSFLRLLDVLGARLVILSDNEEGSQGNTRSESRLRVAERTTHVSHERGR